MKLWVKKKDGNYIRFPYEHLDRLPDGRYCKYRDPHFSSVWLDFEAETGRKLGEFFRFDKLEEERPYPRLAWILKEQEDNDA